MRDERGQSLSAMIAVVLLALFLMTGLVVESSTETNQGESL